MKIDEDKYIVSNHDIYCGNKLLIRRNHGYEYDSSKEEEKKCKDIVKTNKETTVYEKAAMNYNEIGQLTTGSIIKRINKEINEINGHKWDKVILSDGKEGYVFSDNLELTDDYEGLEFEYNNRKYSVYFNPTKYGINIEEYPYYVVGVEKRVGLITICYSKTRIYSNLSGNDNGVFYYTNGSDKALKIDINKDGTINSYIINMANTSVKIDEDKYIVSNHDIYCGSKLICAAHIYDFDKNIDFTTNLNWDNIEPSPIAYSQAKIGEEEYNSMSTIEHLLYDSELKKDRDKLKAALLISQITLPHASAALMYFLSSGEEGRTSNFYPYEEDIYTEGHTMREISFTEAIHNNVAMKERFGQNIKTIINVAEKLKIENGETINFYNITEDYNDTSEDNSIKDKDWHLAIGTYRIKMQCTVTRNDNEYQLNLKYGLVDYYDWLKDENDKTYAEILGNPKGLVIDKLSEEFRKMHQAGVARNYTNFGETYYNLTWNRGEDVELNL